MHWGLLPLLGDPLPPTRDGLRQLANMLFRPNNAGMEKGGGSGSAGGGASCSGARLGCVLEIAKLLYKILYAYGADCGGGCDLYYTPLLPARLFYSPFFSVGRSNGIPRCRGGGAVPQCRGGGHRAVQGGTQCATCRDPSISKNDWTKAAGSYRSSMRAARRK